MGNSIIIACVIGALTISALGLYSCCVVSSRVSRLEEKELWEKEYGTDTGTNERLSGSE